MKLWVAEWLRGTTRFELQPVQRSILIDLLALAGDSRVPGKVCAGFDSDGSILGFPRRYIAALLTVTEGDLAAALELFEKQGRVVVNEDTRGNPVIAFSNWNKYQSEFHRQQSYRQKNKKVTTKVTPEVTTKVTPKTTRRLLVEVEGEGEGDREREGDREKEGDSGVLEGGTGGTTNTSSAPNGADQPASNSPFKRPRLTPNELARLYNEVVPRPLPRVTVPLSRTRAAKVRVRLSDHPDREWWLGVFRKVAESRFLRGESNSGSTWPGATFDWLTQRPNAALKVAEGVYDERSGGRTDEIDYPELEG